MAMRAAVFAGITRVVKGVVSVIHALCGLVARFYEYVIAHPTRVIGVAGAIASIIALCIVLSGRCSRSCHQVLPPLPGGTGWLLVGDYDRVNRMYTRGPFYEVVESNYSGSSKLPRKGEIINITAKRNLIILDFQPNANTDRKLESPLAVGILGHEDYTGIEIFPGTCVEVRDIAVAATHDMPAVVWVRVGEPPER